MGKDDKADRLAAKLRENLRRRKTQAREMDDRAPAKAGAQYPSESGEGEN